MPVEISKRDKVFFPNASLTKGMLADHFDAVAVPLLYHSAGRAATLRRFPDGIDKQGFFQKNTPEHFPTWFSIAKLPTEKGYARYPVIRSRRALLYAVDQGTVEIHIALSKTDKPDLPDRVVFDLDPADGNFEKVRAVALALKRKLDAADIPTFAMVTGGRGMHLIVPLRRTSAGHFDAVRAAAKEIAKAVADECPELATIEQRKAKRGARVFIDYLRNAYGQTCIAPFSSRAKPRAPVATPVSWGDVRSKTLSPHSYTIENIQRRLAQRNDDPWEAFGKSRIGFNSLKNLADT